MNKHNSKRVRKFSTKYIVVSLFILVNVLAIGAGIYYFGKGPILLGALAASQDPTTLAAKCADYAARYPGINLPKVCTDLGIGGTGGSGTPNPTPVGGGTTPVPSTSPGATATATPTPVPGTPRPGEPFANAPACTEHNVRAFHTLWNAERGCHYDHHHGDNPHELDNVLGTDLFTKMGGDISYPWQTFSSAGLENDLKHAGYFWHARKDIPCTSSAPCVTAFRALVHQHPTGRDATIRYHSYVFEAQTSDGGYFMLGGWVDFGDLHAPEGTVVVNVEGNHDSRLGNGAGRHKQHSPTNGQIIWYGASQTRVDENYPRGFVTLSSTIQDSWDYTDPSDPARYDDYVCHGIVPDNRCRINATTLRPHLISVNMINDFNSIIDPDGNGRADFAGYADRYGRPHATGNGCSAYGTDCAPIVMRNMKTGFNYQTADSATALSFRDYDIYFGNLSAGWNQPVP